MELKKLEEKSLKRIFNKPRLLKKKRKKKK